MSIDRIETLEKQARRLEPDAKERQRLLERVIDHGEAFLQRVADPPVFRAESGGAGVLDAAITENGIADDDDTKRPAYLANHIAVVQDMIAHGTDIRAYIHWSLVDNLEWSGGYDLQFGLYGSDPTTPELERTPKEASIGVISQITGSNELSEELLQEFIPGAV